MIERIGFVSNSSSSSFIVIGSGEHIRSKDYISHNQPYFVMGVRGKREFGWEVEVSSDFDSRVNFCLIQAIESKNPENYHMLDQVLYDFFDVPIYVALTIRYGNLREEFWPDEYKKDFEQTVQEFGESIITYGYIDHQSAVCDGKNMGMFESEDKLRNFLFCEDSYIETGNDNDDDGCNPFGW